MTAAPGRIIFLNGTSSSGKSTIAAELLDVLETPYFHLAVDVFGEMCSVRRTAELDADERSEAVRRTLAGFHRAVAGMAAAGNDIVVDHVLIEPWQRADCLHSDVRYDLEVDTTRRSARACAEQIRDFAATHRGTAFAHLRAHSPTPP